jgi:hypothetical protein
MEAQVEAPLATADEDIHVNFRPCEVSNEMQSLKLEKTYGFHKTSNQSLASSKKTSCEFNTLFFFSHCLCLGHSRHPEGEKIITLPKAKTEDLPQTYLLSATYSERTNYLSN